MAVAFAETVVRVLAKSTAMRRGGPDTVLRIVTSKRPQKSTRSAYYFFHKLP